MKMLLYCCKAKPYLYKSTSYKKYYAINEKSIFNRQMFNGKIVAECDFEVEEINPSIYEMYDGFIYNNPQEEEKLKGTCLSAKEMYLYLQDKTGYAIHIMNLHIFYEPKELNECVYLTLEKGFLRKIKKAPQNMCYAYTTRKDKDILISIQPQWLCKILNGEKTIEVRKKVLKEMVKND